jgi:hypothetical protein
MMFAPNPTSVTRLPRSPSRDERGKKQREGAIRNECELGAVLHTRGVTERVRTSALQRLDQPAAVLAVIMRMRV